MSYSDFFNAANRFPLTKEVIRIRNTILNRSKGYTQATVAPPFGATPINTSEWKIRAAEDDAIANQLQITAFTHELKELISYMNIPADYDKTLYAEMQTRKLNIERYLQNCDIHPL